MSGATRRVVVGLGTGRCGTHSLAELLALQPGTAAFHQPPPCLPWHVDYGWYGLARQFIRDQDAEVVAVVGWFYLPYVHLLRRDFDAWFVCLEREREATVASIARLTEQFDHWSNRSPLESATTQYRHLFPDYDVDDKLTAVGRYWDEYAARARQLASEPHARLTVLPTESLNDPVGVATVLDAAGYGAERVVSVGIRAGLMDTYEWKGGGPS